jgi:hypothetical protein
LGRRLRVVCHLGPIIARWLARVERPGKGLSVSSAYTNTVVIGVFELGLVVGTLLTLGAFAAPLFTKNGATAQIVPLVVRQEVERRLVATPALGTAATAARIYDAVKEVVDAAAEANKNLESKANGLIALSSALLGFGVSLANAHRVEHAWLAILGAVALVCAIIICGAREFCSCLRSAVANCI